MARLIRRFDWSATELGPVEAWPQYLRTAVETVVQSPVSMILLCGPAGIMIYNDGYSEIGRPAPSFHSGRARAHRLA